MMIGIDSYTPEQLADILLECGFVSVKFSTGYSQSYVYKVPKGLSVNVGDFVVVPNGLQTQTQGLPYTVAEVVEVYPSNPDSTRKATKYIVSVIDTVLHSKAITKNTDVVAFIKEQQGKAIKEKVCTLLKSLMPEEFIKLIES